MISIVRLVWCPSRNRTPPARSHRICATQRTQPGVWTSLPSASSPAGRSGAGAPDGSTTAHPCCPPPPVPVPSLCEPPDYELLGSSFSTGGGGESLPEKALAAAPGDAG